MRLARFLVRIHTPTPRTLSFYSIFKTLLPLIDWITCYSHSHIIIKCMQLTDNFFKYFNNSFYCFLNRNKTLYYYVSFVSWRVERKSFGCKIIYKYNRFNVVKVQIIYRHFPYTIHDFIHIFHIFSIQRRWIFPQINSPSQRLSFMTTNY